MRIWRIRIGISIAVAPSDRLQLGALVRDRNAPEGAGLAAEIVLLSADGLRLGRGSAIESPAKTASSHGLMFRLSNI
jgi:hypothetical protein